MKSIVCRFLCLVTKLLIFEIQQNDQILFAHTVGPTFSCWVTYVWMYIRTYTCVNIIKLKLIWVYTCYTVFCSCNFLRIYILYTVDYITTYIHTHPNCLCLWINTVLLYQHVYNISMTITNGNMNWLHSCLNTQSHIHMHS